MDVIQPWTIAIGRFDLGTSCTETSFYGELEHSRIRPRVWEYVEKVFDKHDSSWLVNRNTVLRKLSPNQMKDPEVSRGGFLTSLLCLVESDAEIVLMDPRSFIQRGIPPEIQALTTGNHVIRPKLGELYVFPSYVTVYVRPGKLGRTDLICDYDYDKPRTERDNL